MRHTAGRIRSGSASGEMKTRVEEEERPARRHETDGYGCGEFAVAENPRLMLVTIDGEGGGYVYEAVVKRLISVAAVASDAMTAMLLIMLMAMIMLIDIWRLRRSVVSPVLHHHQHVESIYAS